MKTLIVLLTLVAALLPAGAGVIQNATDHVVILEYCPGIDAFALCQTYPVAPGDAWWVESISRRGRATIGAASLDACGFHYWPGKTIREWVSLLQAGELPAGQEIVCESQ